jgi:hypothetical protein
MWLNIILGGFAPQARNDPESSQNQKVRASKTVYDSNHALLHKKIKCVNKETKSNYSAL